MTIDEATEQITRLKQSIDALRPLSKEQIAALWPAWQNDDALFVYNSNAIEGNTLSLSETTVVLEYGITIGGKTVAEHLDALNGAKAYSLMLELARGRVPLTQSVISEVHRAVVGDQPWAGVVRDDARFIRGSRHVPPNPLRVPERMREMLDAYREDAHSVNPVQVAAELHYAFVNIHPYKDGIGRTARLLMNLHLLCHGYAPALISAEDRQSYFASLEASHLAGEPGRGDPLHLSLFVARIEQRALQRSLMTLREIAPELVE